MRLVGTKTDFSGIQGIKMKIRIAWYPQGLQITTEVKLPDVRPPTLVTVQKMCDPGDSRLDFDILLFHSFLFSKSCPLGHHFEPL